jgi:exopolysaccharide biosynthesis protein
MNKSSVRSYKTHFASSLILVFSLCVLCGKTSAQDFKTIHDGVEHAQVNHMIGQDPVKINLLRLDLTKVRLDVHKAFDKAIGLETTSSISKRKTAVAAINGGFFRLDKSEFAGDAVGVFVADGWALSEGVNGRIALIIQNDKKNSSVVIYHLQSATEFRVGIRNFSNPISISGINREQKSGEVIVYGPEFGAATPTKRSGTEIILSRCKNEQEHRGFWYKACNKFQVKRNSSGSEIPRDGFVLAFSSTASKEWETFENEVAKFNPKKVPKIFLEFTYGLDGNTLLFPQPDTDIVTGVPQLIKNGKIDITWEQEKASKSFVETRHPRTAVAKMKDGKFLMVTVDGRQPGVSVGMNLYELAEYLHSLGAVDAMNLDGGGSTTMFLDGKVVNTPSDKEGERKVGDAILVTLRRK